MSIKPEFSDEDILKFARRNPDLCGLSRLNLIELNYQINIGGAFKDLAIEELRKTVEPAMIAYKAEEPQRKARYRRLARELRRSSAKRKAEWEIERAKQLADREKRRRKQEWKRLIKEQETLIREVCF